jgi:hypothetical protein
MHSFVHEGVVYVFVWCVCCGCAAAPLCVLFVRTLGYEAVHRDCSSPLRRVLPPQHASSATYHHNHLAALASTLAIHDELRPKPEEDTGCCCKHVSATLEWVQLNFDPGSPAPQSTATVTLLTHGNVQVKSPDARCDGDARK